VQRKLDGGRPKRWEPDAQSEGDRGPFAVALALRVGLANLDCNGVWYIYHRDVAKVR